jgi:hypothetical protein
MRKNSGLPRVLSGALALFAVGALAPAPAWAHFSLTTPPSSMSQDAAGSPQKLGPCGDEAVTPAATPTGIVTTYQEGQTITVTVDGIVPHPGHWRVALGMTGPKDLPAEPVVTSTTGDDCTSAAIENPPVFPVLADNLLPSTTGGFTGPMSFQVKLPAGVTCTKCTLQVIQFMSNHPFNNPGGCFYHHCADISIVAADGGTSTDAGTTSTSSSGTSSSGASSSGTSSSGTSSSGSSGTTTSSGAAATSSGGTGTTSTGAGGAGTTSTESSAATSGAGGGAPASSSSPAGCGCSVPASSSSLPFGLAGLLAIAALERGRAGRAARRSKRGSQATRPRA